MDPAPRERGQFRRDHPIFFRGAIGLAALFLLGAGVVASRIPRYRSETAELSQLMTATQRATRDSMLAGRQRRTMLAWAVLRRDMRIRSYESKQRHLAISLEDSVLELRHGPATLRRARLQIGPDTTIRAADGRTWRLVRPVGERQIEEVQTSPVYAVPEWVYVARGQAVPSEAQRRMPGALGAYVIRMDDGTEIYSRPSAGPFAQGVKPAAFVADAQDLAAIFEAVGEGTPVYIY